MGGRGGIQTETVENPIVPLGNNLYETGTIEVSADSVIKAGVVLYRAPDGKFAPVTDTSPATISADVGGDETEIPIPGTSVQPPVAVNPFDIPNKAQTAADLSIRALISGQVRADLLTIDDDPITVAQMDMLRAYGIIPIKVNDLSRTE
jgi:hypothetical protein